MLKGKLARACLGYTMPPTSPLFPRPPIVYRDVESVGVMYETDSGAALDILPEPLELDEPAMATLGVYQITKSGLGAYCEAYLSLSVRFQGEPKRYSAMFLVTNDMAMAMGREVLGVPKKLGKVIFERHPEGIFAYGERPTGNRLFSITVAPEYPIEPPAPWAPIPGAVALRMIGEPTTNVQDPAPVSVELLETPSRRRVIEMWSARGSISFPNRSEIDNWQILPVNRVIDAFFAKIDVELPPAKLLARL